jgi:hypothetical protein
MLAADVAADVAAVSDGSLVLDGEADARVGGALGGERESSLRRDCLNPGILVAFVLQKRTRRGLRRRERKSKTGAFSSLRYSNARDTANVLHALGKI